VKFRPTRGRRQSAKFAPNIYGKMVHPLGLDCLPPDQELTIDERLHLTPLLQNLLFEGVLGVNDDARDCI